MPVSVQEFAGKVKQKYPQYQGIDDVTLTQKMIQKYPEYKNQVDMGGGMQQQPQTQVPQQATQSQPQQQSGGFDWNRMLNPFAAPTFTDAVMQTASPEKFKQMKDEQAQFNQSMYEAPQKALDWIHQGTQGFRDWMDKGAEWSGLNDMADEANRRIQQDTSPWGQASRFLLGKGTNIGQNAMPAFISGIGNQVKAIGNPFGLGSLISGVGDAGSNIAQQSTGGDESAKSLGDLTGNVASQVPAIIGAHNLIGDIFGGGAAAGQALEGGTKALTTGETAANAVANTGKTGLVNKIIQKAPEFLANSASGSEIASAATKGEAASPMDLATGLGFDTALAGAGAILKGAGKKFWEQMIPSTPTQKAIQEGRGIDIGKSLAEDIKPVASRKGFLKQANDKIAEYSGQLDDLAKSIPDKIDPYNIPTKGLTELEDNVKKIVEKMPFSEREKVASAFQEEVASVQKRIGDKPLSVPDLLDLKREFDKVVPYNKLDPLNNVKTAVNKTAADNIRAVLKEIDPRITDLNDKMAPLIQARNIVKNKGEYSKTLGDVIGLTTGMSGDKGLWQGVKNVAGQRVLRSPAFLSTAGSGTYNLGEFIQKLQKESSPVVKTALGLATKPEQKKTIKDFAKMIKEQYPQYKDIDDETLVMAILSKFPERAGEIKL